MSKFNRKKDTFLQDPIGPNPPNGFEVGSEIFGKSRVIVGLSVRMHPGTITTLQVFARRLDSETGELFGDVHVFVGGSDPHHTLERNLNGNNLDDGPNRVMGGFWGRAEPGTITSMLIWTKAISEEGILEGLVPIQTGTTPPNGYEAEVVVPAPFVATGVAMRARSGDVTHIKGLFSVLEPA